MPPVLGVDCGSKTSAVFDGREFYADSPSKLRDRLDRLKATTTLVCWDAPLTGPPCVSEVCDDEGAYSMRPIERFFNPRRTSSALQKAGLVPPLGVNTLGYSGMSHWAVTRALTGHPRVGPYDAEPRFSLAQGDREPDPMREAQLAEVHPAVALWLWIRSEGAPETLFAYKVSRETSAEQRRERTKNLAEMLCSKLANTQADPQLVFGDGGSKNILGRIDGNSDYLDAYVAWVLGRLWAAGSMKVMQLGSAENGSFLLPENQAVRAAWQEERGGGGANPQL